jgi:hypothetical protein
MGDEELRMRLIKKRNNDAINFLKGKYDDERRGRIDDCYKGFIYSGISVQEIEQVYQDGISGED